MSKNKEFMTDSQPLVSVIMAAYNSEQFIAEAIDSIVAQSYSKWELVIVDDGSTDSTAEIVREKAAQEPRIRFFQQENSGAAAARNRAIQEAKGKYLAVLDSDDLALPQRLKKQVAFLEEHPKVVLVGGGYREIGDSNKVITLPTSNGALQYTLTFHSPFAHSAVIFRREAAGAGYPTALRTAQDFALLSRLSARGEIANLPEVLSLYRVHPLSLSGQHKGEQKANATSIIQKNIMRWLPEATEEESRALAQTSFAQGDSTLAPEELRQFHQRLLSRFLDLFPEERREIQKIAQQRIALSREAFFGEGLCEKLRKFKAMALYYRRWPKSLLYLTIKECSPRLAQQIDRKIRGKDE